MADDIQHNHQMTHVHESKGIDEQHTLKFTHSHENGDKPHHHVAEDTPIPDKPKDDKDGSGVKQKENQSIWWGE